jgi:hypothetical protein
VDLSMSEFVDFHVLTGSARVAKVRALKNRGEYDPATDFWRPLRVAIVAFHLRPTGDARSLSDFLGPVSERKMGRYRAAMAGHQKFLRRREIAGSRAPSAPWNVGDLSVRVNPDLGLRVDGNQYLVKLYFKAEPLSRGRTQALIALMEEGLRPRVAAGLTFGVLDVPNASLRLADARSSMNDTQIALRSEAVAFVEIWGRV